MKKSRRNTSPNGLISQEMINYSAVITSFNSENTIERALASIFHQSTSAHFFSFLKFSFFLHRGQLWKAPREYSVASLDACSLTPTAKCKIHFQAKSSYSHVYRILSMQFWICQLNFFEILSRSKALCYKFWTVQPVINMFKV